MIEKSWKHGSCRQLKNKALFSIQTNPIILQGNCNKKQQQRSCKHDGKHKSLIAKRNQGKGDILKGENEVKNCSEVELWWSLRKKFSNWLKSLKSYFIVDRSSEQNQQVKQNRCEDYVKWQMTGRIANVFWEFRLINQIYWQPE